MISLFVYGTLRHIRLLEIVLGRGADAIEMSPAQLADHAVFWAKGQSFPLLVAQNGAQASGLLLRGITEQDLARLDYYEGGFGYALSPVQVETAQATEAAQVWFPEPGLWAVGAPWLLEDWAATWGAITERAAIEVMDYYGRYSPSQIAGMFPMIRARAASYVAAQNETPPPSPSGLGRGDVQDHNQNRAYTDFFAVEEHHLSFKRFDGSDSPVVKRAVYKAADAALVLPYDPKQDAVLLIEQFRAGPYVRGDHAPWALEPIAGRVDPGETPEQAAHREAKEEADLTLGRLELITNSYPSPGSTSEFFHIFLGLTDLTGVGGRVGGVAGEDEDIRSHILSFDVFMERIDNDELTVGPLILAGLWLARHRDRLRATS